MLGLLLRALMPRLALVPGLPLPLLLLLELPWPRSPPAPPPPRPPETNFNSSICRLRIVISSDARLTRQRAVGECATGLEFNRRHRESRSEQIGDGLLVAQRNVRSPPLWGTPAPGQGAEASPGGRAKARIDAQLLLQAGHCLFYDCLPALRAGPN